MKVTARVDYAVRAATLLAAAYPADGTAPAPMKGDRLADAQGIPVKYLEQTLSLLRQHGLVRSQRGSDGGYWLARPPGEITVADIIRAVEGPLAEVRGERAESLDYPEGTGALQEVWVAVRSALRGVLDRVTLADVASGALPDDLRPLVDDPDAWRPR
jgi:Rrf2 family protein